ncbi:hypothetical protein PTTG_06901 [Puccinia triticina 1-1 BBBD Race 1]|uniref:Glucose-6-phosphate 1-epimerase n=2 Tax=Puccinia triticina TaxID=208348 RepID=A0A180G905_PUCT1|nr:uncharacterized protein PtA15_13A391 [Puccinia triticina]OAV89167.1 hypothetical protein PTTG_06901 [Puccinia triticina 1-1 BBBD Race 1]WAQ90991.1 hypothetical protein PtA15_13A391 [Puccinia triticina]WAR61179.1 hypothetical protein PtB15_13B431 [Puccinia triticina]
MGYTRTQSSIIIQTSLAHVAIALHGAHVYSWKVQGQDQLFLSSASSISGPAAIRGGIPICFPVFGPPPSREPYSSLTQHGFARNTKWSFEGMEEGSDWVEARFSLSSKNSEVEKVFKPAFDCLYKVKIYQQSLVTSLEVTNPSESSLEFQALLHTYLCLPTQGTPQDVRLGPLKGLSFADKVAQGAVAIEDRETVDFLQGEVDRVYRDVPSVIEVDLGHGKKMTIKTEGLPDLTVWNPHEAKSNAMADMENEGWKRFVCIEPGQTSFVSLEPKGVWKGSQELIAHI